VRLSMCVAAPGLFGSRIRNTRSRATALRPHGVRLAPMSALPELEHGTLRGIGVVTVIKMAASRATVAVKRPSRTERARPALVKEQQPRCAVGLGRSPRLARRGSHASGMRCDAEDVKDRARIHPNRGRAPPRVVTESPSFNLLCGGQWKCLRGIPRVERQAAFIPPLPRPASPPSLPARHDALHYRWIFLLPANK
jgi:hypothetical protein